MAEARERTALIVDDDAGIREFVSTVLQRHGFLTISACSAADAVQLFQTRAEAIDIFILDVELGEDDGLDLARKFGSQNEGAVFLLISGNPIHEGRAIAEGCRFLAKPFLSARLIEAVHGVLSRSADQSG